MYSNALVLQNFVRQEELRTAILQAMLPLEGVLITATFVV